MALDYFEITTTEQEKQDAPFAIDQDAMARLVELGPRYAKAPEGNGVIKPRRVPIRVDSDKIDDFLMQEYRVRVPAPVMARDGVTPLMKTATERLMRPQVWCHGNGVQAFRGFGDDKRPIPCNASPSFPPRPQDELMKLLKRGKDHNPEDGKRCPFAQNNDGRAGPMCKPETVQIQRCEAVAGVGAFARFRSHGHGTADAMRNSIEQIKKKMPDGILSDVPLDLVLTMKRFPVPGSSATTAKPVVHVELRLPVEDTVRLLNANLQQHMQVSEGRKRMLLEAKVEADTDEAAAEYIDTHVVVAGADGGGGLKS